MASPTPDTFDTYGHRSEQVQAKETRTCYNVKRKAPLTSLPETLGSNGFARLSPMRSTSKASWQKCLQRDGHPRYSEEDGRTQRGFFKQVDGETHTPSTIGLSTRKSTVGSMEDTC